MKKPATRTMTVGHPFVAGPLMLTGFVTLFAAFHADSLVVIILALAMLAKVSTAYEQANAYRAWAREWNGMAPDNGPRPRKRVPRWLLVALPALALFGLLRLGGASVGNAAQGVGLLAAVVGTVVLLGAAIWRWARRSRHRARSFVVAVVARPAMAAPSLTDAYRALPSFCHALLRGQE